MRRRLAMALLGSTAWRPSRASAPAGPTALDLPEPMAQLAAGGPSGLLGVAASGTFYALDARDGHGARSQRLADGLDASSPLANGHGRIAARQRDGALWVYEAGRARRSRERALASQAGLLVLPLAVIAVERAGDQHRLLRLEASGEHWAAVARSSEPVLPDARLLQADLDGSGDGGQVLVLAGPDGERYRHGVLGDAIEATSLLMLERHTLTPLRTLSLPAPHVFEDLAPRLVQQSGRDALLLVQAGPEGAQLVLVDADPARPAALRVAARGPAIGTRNRWLSPTAQGPHWMAVHTPHLGGVLHRYRREGERLHAEPLGGDISNHVIGSRQLDLSVWHGERLLMPDQRRRRLLLLDPAAAWQPVREWTLPAAVVGSTLFEHGTAWLLEDGTVSVLPKRLQ